jgi:hypothetical protein
MSGRRSHVRFEVIPSSEGVLRLLRDVLVVSAEEDEAVVLSRDPGVVGETLMLEIPGAQASSGQATVVECRPVIVDGTMRHRLRLQQASEMADRPATPDRRAGVVEG